jgi:hypothetical protein
VPEGPFVRGINQEQAAALGAYCLKNEIAGCTEHDFANEQPEAVVNLKVTTQPLL